MSSSKSLALFLILKIVFFNLVEFYKTLFRYYRSFSFFWIDLYFHLAYLFINPYRLVECYGETPLSTMDKIAKECRILSKDVFYDLGCGRGRNLFWLSSFIKCQTKGVEIHPLFVQKGNRLKRRSLVTFIHQKIEEVNLIGATVIYIYGTSFSDSLIETVIKKCEALPRNTKIITVSFALEEYAQKDLFQLKSTFRASFPWGKADVFYQVRT